MEYKESDMLVRNNPSIMEKLKKGKVAIAGLGGLGSNIAVSLARIGVGNLLLVDFDVVEPSNLNRQHYSWKHVGMDKTEALRMQLEEINPFIHVEVKKTYIEKEQVAELFCEYPIVCEAFDKPENKAMLINTLLQECPEKKIVSGSGMAGYHSSNLIQTRKRLHNLYVCGDLENEATVENGIMSPRVLICVGHQANMIVRILAGEECE